MSRKEQAAKTKSRIVKSIMDLLSENSWNVITIRDICNESGMSVGAFYHYFKNKEEAILATNTIFDEWLQHKLDKKHFASYREELLYVIDCYTANSVYCGSAGIALILSNDLITTDTYNDEDRFLAKKIKSCISAAVLAGEFSSDTDAEILTTEILCIIRGVNYEWCMKKEGFDISGTTRRLIENLIDRN